MIHDPDPESCRPPCFALYADFLAELRLRGFEGDITHSSCGPDRLCDRQLDLPGPAAGGRLPAQRDSTSCASRSCRASRASAGSSFAPRGGGTGTNGQSLTNGIVVDLSRHMNAILEINAEEGWARVQAGVVKDQLNDAIRAARPVLRARAVAVQPRHHRRHDRHRCQRPGFGAVRQDARPRPRAEGRPARRHGVAFAPAGGVRVRGGQAQRRPHRRDPSPARPHPRRRRGTDRGALSEAQPLRHRLRPGSSVRRLRQLQSQLGAVRRRRQPGLRHRSQDQPRPDPDATPRSSTSATAASTRRCGMPAR